MMAALVALTAIVLAAPLLGCHYFARMSARLGGHGSRPLPPSLGIRRLTANYDVSQEQQK